MGERGARRPRAPRPGDIVFFDHESARDEAKRRRGVVVSVDRSAGSASIAPGLSDPPPHNGVVTFWWTPAAVYAGLEHDTHFDLFDLNEVPFDAVTKVGKLPPDLFRAIERALEALGGPSP